MSAADSPPGPGMAAGVELQTSRAAILEVAAQRGCSSALVAIAAERRCALPTLGRATITGGQLALAVRPERWLVVQARDGQTSPSAQWQAACAGVGTVVDFSSGLAVLQLSGPEARAVLARSCRLDLDPQHFPTGTAAATLIAQVATMIVAMPRGLLLLTPSSTARHFCEWLQATARPFGIGPTRAADLAEFLAE